MMDPKQRGVAGLCILVGIREYASVIYIHTCCENKPTVNFIMPKLQK